MSQLDVKAFQPLINSSHTAFTSSAITASVAYALEATGTRQWGRPTSRTVRVHGVGTANYFVNFGSSDVTVGSTNGVLCGGVAALFSVTPAITHIAMYSSTSAVVNVALGAGL